jgi:hypothetical protein
MPRARPITFRIIARPVDARVERLAEADRSA